MQGYRNDADSQYHELIDQISSNLLLRNMTAAPLPSLGGTGLFEEFSLLARSNVPDLVAKSVMASSLIDIPNAINTLWNTPAEEGTPRCFRDQHWVSPP